MSLELKVNEKPDLKNCPMSCDRTLHKKLDNFELSKFLNVHSTNIFIGKPKSGKTNLIYSFFKSKQLLAKVFHNIYLFQPAGSRGSMNDKIFEKGIPEEQIFEDLDFDSLNSVMNTIKEEDSKYNNCIIFDDMTSKLKDSEISKLMKELVQNKRHLNVSVFFLVQTWFSIPKDIRKLFDNIFVFRVSKKELETIFDEVVEQKKEHIHNLAKLVYDEKYKYLFINTETQRLFKGFDEIIIKGEFDE